MERCVKVEKGKAEALRKKLSADGLLDGGYAPARDSRFVYFPLKAGVKAPTGVKTANKKLVKRQEFAKPFADELEGKLTQEERAMLVTSFDLVGDIAVVEVPEGLEGKEKLIATAIMRQQHGVLVVAKKIGGTAGEFRIRPVKVIAGEERTSTVYREGGCSFELDLNRTYFTPRLGTERTRIAALVKPDEFVVVPFAGVGPFAIRIAKKVKTARVAGVELNPDACNFFRRNVLLNKCGNVEVLQGDAALLLPGRFRGRADRIAMPLPKDSSQFLANLIPCLKKGGMLHYYAFGEIENPYENAEREIFEAAKKLGRKARVVFKRVVRPYSKTSEQIVIDVKVD